MSTSHFSFLTEEWPEIFAAAAKAEALAYPDARSSCFYARRALELSVQWLYTHDKGLRLPYQDHLSALIHELTFRQTVGVAVFTKIKLIKELGNLTVHSSKPVRPLDAIAASRELFHFAYWLARTYGRRERPAPGLVFNAERLPKTAPVPAHTLQQLQRLETDLHERDARLTEVLSNKAALDEELMRLRAEIAAAKQLNAAQADTHDYSEAETRDFFIDLLLKEAGWPLDKPQDREFEVSGMPNTEGKGFVDYVLWGADGRPLGLVEAKRSKRDPRVGQQQAKLYADCLERQFGQRPVIFYSNGYEHWLWDDVAYPPRPNQGFYKKDELELMIQRRGSRKSLADAAIDQNIVERYYQVRAIRRIGETFERDRLRKALVVMATGAGKTRTVIALVDLLMRCNWAKRVLFLADRVALVNQAVNAFKKHLPDASPVNLVTEKEADARVYVSTYPTMMSLIDEAKDGQRRFGAGHFDLLIIDEAHRSVYQKYRAIFEYFDALLVGLTATPKDEIDRNTYGLFDLDMGVPTDAYALDDAVNDGYLVPPKSVSVPLKFQREGIRYAELSEDEKDQWDALEWGEDNEVPDRVGAEAINRWLFNKDTVDKVLEYLMTRGLTVAGGDRLGKTIIFAKNHAHAEFISERFNANYPHYQGTFARVIDFKVEYAQSVIDDFSNAAESPHIAISVDMLDTGIDIPEVVNLVFFKLVRSKTKFWQMVGRGTRLCKELFGPGQDKAFFYIFDFCQNLEFFSQDLPATGGGAGESLSKRLFKIHLELIAELDKVLLDAGSLTTIRAGETAEVYGEPKNEAELRQAAAQRLHAEVAAMNVNNFVVRPKRLWVEKYAQFEAWRDLSRESLGKLADKLAGLPTEREPEDEEAKRFDVLLLNLQLALLRHEPGFARLCERVKAIAGLLEEAANIPMVQQQIALIQDLQTDEWWQDVTAPQLEVVRRRLRLLVQFLEKRERRIMHTDFEDVLEADCEFELPVFRGLDSFERFRTKARLFLKAHEHHIAIHKLRMNEPLTALDLAELERMLAESGIGSTEELAQAKAASEGLGLFIRSLVGLDRQAADEAFGAFLVGKTLRANQIEFVRLIIEYLTQHGTMDSALLYESPFTDFNPQGVEGVFRSDQVEELISILEDVRARAVA